jgi:hypothetical protein
MGDRFQVGAGVDRGHSRSLKTALDSGAARDASGTDGRQLGHSRCHDKAGGR